MSDNLFTVTEADEGRSIHFKTDSVHFGKLRIVPGGNKRAATGQIEWADGSRSEAHFLNKFYLVSCNT